MYNIFINDFQESTTPLAGCLKLQRLNIAHNLLNSVAECLSAIGKLPDLRRLEVYVSKKKT